MTFPVPLWQIADTAAFVQTPTRMRNRPSAGPIEFHFWDVALTRQHVLVQIAQFFIFETRHINWRIPVFFPFQVECCRVSQLFFFLPVVRKIRRGARTCLSNAYFISHQVNSKNPDKKNKAKDVSFILRNFRPESVDPLRIKLLAFVCRSANPNATSCRNWCYQKRWGKENEGRAKNE